MKTLTFVIDIDDTISEWNDNRDYLNFIPKQNMIDKINSLYDKGHIINLFTSRGMLSEKGNLSVIDTKLRPPLEEWLKNNNVKHHKLITGKPPSDYYIDDKNLYIDDFLNKEFDDDKN